MKYYAIYNTITKELFKGQVKCLNAEVENVEITKEVYDELEKYMYLDGSIVINPNYEAEQALKERERIAKLYLTGADVERGIYKAKGMDFEDIIEMVETLIFADAPQVQGIDLKALRIELKANHFYRGNPYVGAVGALLGFTVEQLDKFFETNDYTTLLSQSDKVEEESDIVESDKAEE